MITKEQLLEGNRIIATFLWGEPHKDIFDDDEWQADDYLPIVTMDGYYESEDIFTADMMRFHVDWVWIMLLVTKIQEVVSEPEDIDELKNVLWYDDQESIYGELVDVVKRINSKEIKTEKIDG